MILAYIPYVPGYKWLTNTQYSLNTLMETVGYAVMQCHNKTALPIDNYPTSVGQVWVVCGKKNPNRDR